VALALLGAADVGVATRDAAIAFGLGFVPLAEERYDLVVIGGGVIGLEMGMVFLKLGSRLTVVELTDSLLPGTDPEAVKALERSLAKRGATVLKSTKAGGVVAERGKHFVTAKGADGTDHRIPADLVLVAVGSAALVGGLALLAIRRRPVHQA